jgi:hypothetical protein
LRVADLLFIGVAHRASIAPECGANKKAPRTGPLVNQIVGA